MNLLTNSLKTLNFYKSSLLSSQSASKLLRISLSLRKRKGEIFLKTLSLKLNIRLYNKLSKEVGDFKDLEDERIYT